MSRHFSRDGRIRRGAADGETLPCVGTSDKYRAPAPQRPTGLAGPVQPLTAPCALTLPCGVILAVDKSVAVSTSFASQKRLKAYTYGDLDSATLQATSVRRMLDSTKVQCNLVSKA